VAAFVAGFDDKGFRGDLHKKRLGVASTQAASPDLIRHPGLQGWFLCEYQLGCPQRTGSRIKSGKALGKAIDDKGFLGDLYKKRLGVANIHSASPDLIRRPGLEG